MKYTWDNNKLTIETAGAYEGKTVEDFLNDFMQSRKNKYLLLQKKLIFLNHTAVKDIHEPIHQQNITLINEEREIDWKMAKEPCEVVYEDPFVYIAHKKPGAIIHGDADDIECLNAQAARYQQIHDLHVPVRPIHRLDQDTTGLVLYSKLPFFQPWFDAQLAAKKIRRNYLAICIGKASIGQKLTCTQSIGRDRHVSNKYRISSTGVSAVTHIECLDVRGNQCLMKCTLETGRTHQIRVHLASRGYPIVNDKLYGTPSQDYPNMCLWAYEIEIHNPITHKKHKIHDFPNPSFEQFNLYK